MQDNPPPPGDIQAPHEPDEQAQPNQQPPDGAHAPENPASPSPKEPPQVHPPQDEDDIGLDRWSVSDAQRLLARDGDGWTADAGAGSLTKSALGEQLEQAGIRLRTSARPDIPHLDDFTDLDIGLQILEERLPDQHPELADVETLMSRLKRNIRSARIFGDTPDGKVERNKIIAELNNQTLLVIGVKFEKLDHAPDLEDERGETNNEVPRTRAEVGPWFNRLNWNKRCFVIAACALQGGPSHEISRAAQELYVLIESVSRQPSVVLNETHLHTHGTVEPPLVLVDELLSSTYTVERKIKGVERIVWRDAGVDPWVREFLARQAMTVGMRFADRSLLDILEEWVVSGNDERVLRAGHMLADLWWRQHQDKVLNLAETWARSDNENVWQGGAALLYGAYAAERAERPRMKAEDSEVLRRLRGWADWRDDAELAQVAAYTYGLIGRQWPDVALDGLDHLLCLGEFARTNNAFPPISVVFMAVLSYIEMATAGQVRSLLNRFANHASDYARHTLKSRAVFEDAHLSSIRERRLDILFFHVVFLMALAQDGVRQRRTHASYLTSIELAPLPDMPSARGQDVLLTGVLAEPEQEWRANVQTLFCAAIFSRRESFVFDVLESWIRIVTFEPHGDASDALLRFVVGMHAQLRAWDAEPQHKGRVKGSVVLEQRMSLWTKATHEHVLRPFALRVLDELHH